jgi:hypothetical protein
MDVNLGSNPVRDYVLLRISRNSPLPIDIDFHQFFRHVSIGWGIDRNGLEENGGMQNRHSG